MTSPPTRRLYEGLCCLFGLALPVATLFWKLSILQGMMGAIAVMGAANLIGRRHPRPLDLWIWGLTLIFLAWAAVTLSWTFDATDAFERWMTAAATVVGGLLLIDLAARSSAKEAQRLAQGLFGGLLLSSVIFLEEWLFGAPLLFWLFPDSGGVADQLAMMNRAIALLVLLLWSLVSRLWDRWSWKSLLLPLAFLVVILPLNSSASALALGVGLLTACLVALAPRLAWRLLLVALPLVLLANPLICQLLYDVVGIEEGSLPNTARYRVQIWDFAADRIFDRPLLGWGFEAARLMPNFGEASISGNATIIPVHPHNAPLQVWLELGLIGELLLIVLLMRLVQRLRRLDRAAQIAGAAALTTGLVISFLSFGAWQGHTLAAYLLAAAFFVMLRKNTAAAPASATTFVR